jgi:hypothetical protein
MNFQELMKKMSELEKPVVENDTMTDIDQVEECGMMMPPVGPMDPPKQQDSVTMNVSMNGSGAGGIKDLMNILRNIESGDVDIDNDNDSEKLGIDTPDVIFKKNDDDNDKTDLIDDEYEINDEYGNEPDEIYQDTDSVTGTGDDIHSNNGDHRMRQTGLPVGNPRSVDSGTTYKLPSGDLKIRLESLYKDIKSR